MDQRIPVAPEDLMLALRRLSDGLQQRVKEKGNGSFIGLHEIDGILDEEVREFKGEVHADDRMAALEELIDIGVTSLFAIASISAILHQEIVHQESAKAAEAKKPGTP